MTNFYHISAPENKESILSNGITAGTDNYVYLIKSSKELMTKLISPYIAFNQLGLDNYSVFSINPKGIYTEIEADEVGELFAKFQRRIKQNIDKKYIRFVADMQTEYKQILNIQKYVTSLKLV